MNDSIRILIIEEDEEFRKTLINILGKEGHVVEGTSNGQHALGIAKEKTFDIIISDIRLPDGFDGKEVLAKIRSSQESKLKMILMTGFKETYDEEKAKQLGIIGHLIKPFETDVLLGLINKGIQELKRES